MYTHYMSVLWTYFEHLSRIYIQYINCTKCYVINLSPTKERQLLHVNCLFSISSVATRRLCYTQQVAKNSIYTNAQLIPILVVGYWDQTPARCYFHSAGYNLLVRYWYKSSHQTPATSCGPSAASCVALLCGGDWLITRPRWIEREKDRKREGERQNEEAQTLKPHNKHPIYIHTLKIQRGRKEKERERQILQRKGKKFWICIITAQQHYSNLHLPLSRNKLPQT